MVLVLQRFLSGCRVHPVTDEPFVVVVGVANASAGINTAESDSRYQCRPDIALPLAM